MVRDLMKVVYLDGEGETQTYLFDELKCVNGSGGVVFSGKLDGVRQRLTLDDFIYLRVGVVRCDVGGEE